MIPTVCPYDADELAARIRMIQKITDFLGLPIFDEEIMDEFHILLKGRE